MKFIKKFSSIEEYEAAELSYPATSLVSGTVIYDKELTPQYRTLTTATTCIGYDKYTLEEYQVSMDRGKTWTTTGTSATTLIEADSEDCGYVPPVSSPKWVATYSDSHTSSAECGSSSAITNGEIDGTNLVSVEIGDCVEAISEGAFQSCTSLTSVVIPNTVVNIGDSAFRDCYSLSSVTIPDGVTSIGAFLFFNCRSLTSIAIPSGVTTVDSESFGGCNSLTSVTIPDSVTSIGSYAFEWCYGLTSVTIGSGITSIGVFAFGGCSGLTSITIEATTPPTLGADVFDNTNDCPIYVPEESVNAYKNATNWSTYASRIQAIDGPQQGYDAE